MINQRRGGHPTADAESAFFQELCSMTQAPLAERVRPLNLDDLVGQDHLTGPGSILRVSIERGSLPSMILWGPSGTGKTTLAGIISLTTGRPFFALSAISAGVKEIREVIEAAREAGGAILFIDEIHRFNKGQQDALLGAVEKGIVTLIGATTETHLSKSTAPYSPDARYLYCDPLKRMICSGSSARPSSMMNGCPKLHRN